MTSEILAGIAAACGTLIAGMAGLLKVMVLGRLDTLQKSLEGLHQDVHEIDLRLTRLETEHRVQSCIYSRDPGDDR